MAKDFRKKKKLSPNLAKHFRKNKRNSLQIWRFFSEKQEYCDRRFPFNFIFRILTKFGTSKQKKKDSVPNIGIVASPTESFGHLKKLRKGVCPQKAQSRGYRKGVCLSTKSSISRLLGRGFICQKLNLAVIRKGVCPAEFCVHVVFDIPTFNFLGSIGSQYIND